MPVYDDFMIVSMARSGTSFLRDLINSVDGCHCFGEIFRLRGDSLSELSKLLQCTEYQVLQKKNSGKAEFWREIRLSPNRMTPSIGAKLFYSHVDWDDPLWSDIHSHKIIHLIRGNALELFISVTLATRSNIWKSTEYDRRYDEGSISVSLDEFLEFKAKRDRQAAVVREKYQGPKYLEILYEDLLKPRGPETFLQQAFGIEPKAIRSRLQKQRRRTLQDLIVNYHQVERFDRVERQPANTRATGSPG